MFIPLLIDVKNWKVLIFGGGRVGYRRTKLFLESGALQIFVAAKDFTDELVNIAKTNKKIKLIKVDIPQDFEKLKNIMDKVTIVIIASSNQNANRIVRELAIREGKLVNDATEASKGNVIVPFHSWIYENGLLIAISSLGKSGIAAHEALEKVVKWLENDLETKTLYNVMSEVKRYMKSKIASPKARFGLYFEIEKDPRFRNLIRQGKVREAYFRAIEIIRNSLNTI